MSNNNNKKCFHGFELDSNGKHIIPNNEAVNVDSLGYIHTTQPQPQTKQQKEFEQSVKKWDQFYKRNQGKIPAEFPKTIFDENFSKSKPHELNNNEVKKFSKLINDK